MEMVKGHGDGERDGDEVEDGDEESTLMEREMEIWREM
jgi:hypothetical protein